MAVAAFRKRARQVPAHLVVYLYARESMELRERRKRHRNPSRRLLDLLIGETLDAGQDPQDPAGRLEP
jgi:hypothetical protein